jgi:hypothetical protein
MEHPVQARSCSFPRSLCPRRHILVSNTDHGDTGSTGNSEKACNAFRRYLTVTRGRLCSAGVLACIALHIFEIAGEDACATSPTSPSICYRIESVASLPMSAPRQLRYHSGEDAGFVAARCHHWRESGR